MPPPNALTDLPKSPLPLSTPTRFQVRERTGKLVVPAVCIGSALAYFGPGSQPIWVAALIKNGLLTTSQIGWLASGELLLIAISTLAVSAWGLRLSPRRVAVAAASLVAIANAVAMIPAVEAVVLGRLLSAISMGALLACTTGVAARRRDAQRVFALTLGAALLLVGTAFFLSPNLVGRYGPAGLFALVASIGVVAAAAALLGLPDLVAEAERATRVAGTSKLAPLLACLALASVAAGIATVATYVITIGNGLGFDGRTMATALAMTTPLAVLGPVAAHLLGERAGLLRPVLLSLIVITIDMFFLVSAASPVFLGVYMAVLSVAWMFCLPYAIAFVSRVDPSGRFASAAQAFVMIGAAAGPKLGSELIGFAHFQALATGAAPCVTVGILLFLAASGLAKKQKMTNSL